MNDSKIIQPLGDGKRRILSPEEAMRQLDAYQPPKPQLPQDGKPAGTKQEEKAEVIPVSYIDLEWEPRAYKRGDPTYSFTYDDSLERLRKAGYERHPRPAEIFNLILAHLNEKIHNLVLNDLVKDMLESHSNWLSMAFERKDNTLVCYVDPENLVWDENDHKYVVDGKLKFSDKKEFYIGPIDMITTTATSSKGLVISYFSDELVSFLYTTTFDKLHIPLLGSTIYAPCIILPSEQGEICPVSRGRDFTKFYLDSQTIFGADSQGLREKK